MLFQELLASTMPDSEDYAQILEARKKIGQVVAVINEAKSKAEALNNIEIEFFNLLEDCIKDLGVCQQ